MILPPWNGDAPAPAQRYLLLMKRSSPDATIDSLPIEIDAKAVRGEAIRVIRGLFDRRDRFSESSAERSRPASFFSVVRIMRDLELAMMAISESLADGVAHAGGRRAPLENTSADEQPANGSAPPLR